MISDWRNYESWAEAGRPDSAHRALELAHTFLSAYEQPAMDPAVAEELHAFVARRVAEGGIPTDY
jgi:trimethylamine--corrinoid protein Co-methyltransferase